MKLWEAQAQVGEELVRTVQSLFSVTCEARVKAGEKHLECFNPLSRNLNFAW